ncbi:MAG: hypothetical protein M0R37_13630 [Bacteroidales bacterium]|nr:hypothetical protein [Bacteroidales bacterium]
MSRFENKERTRRIDLGDGDWAEIPEVISFDTAARMGEASGDATKVILSVVTGWNLTEDGKAVELNEANVRRLDIATVNAVITAVSEAVTLPKAQKPG